jgi:phosphatidylserine/phosphatidylglycerophosphate/cardiolipin synthase-like enzyme
MVKGGDATSEDFAMSARREAASSRPVLYLLAIMAPALSTAATGCAGGNSARVLPPYAMQPVGASFEGYPEIGRVQKRRILEEMFVSSASDFAHAPCTTLAKQVGRIGERLGVRAVEIAGLDPPVRTLDPCALREGDLGGGYGGPPTAARLTLLPGSEISIQALLSVIASAQNRIDLMMYGWDDDPTGREIAEALASRARNGVLVRVMADRGAFLIHNAAVARRECTFLDALAQVPNVYVIEPPNPFLRLDHRKLAVIDDRVAWTGGMILTEVARRRWQNLAYLAEGPIVAQFEAVFAERWSDVGGCPAPACPGQCEAAAAAVPNALVRLLRSDDSLRTLKQAVYHAVDHARHHIYLENPYFSDEILTEKLKAAQARGVQVHAILTLRGNMKALNQFETLTANRLLRNGVHVYLYPIMTHVKAMSVDSIWAYIGTGNFDDLSLRNNYEVGLSVSSPAVVCALDQQLFLPDLAASEELHALLPPPRNRLMLEALSIWY